MPPPRVVPRLLPELRIPNACWPNGRERAGLMFPQGSDIGGKNAKRERRKDGVYPCMGHSLLSQLERNYGSRWEYVRYRNSNLLYLDPP